MWSPSADKSSAKPFLQTFDPKTLIKKSARGQRVMWAEVFVVDHGGLGGFPQKVTTCVSLHQTQIKNWVLLPGLIMFTFPVSQEVRRGSHVIVFGVWVVDYFFKHGSGPEEGHKGLFVCTNR